MSRNRSSNYHADYGTYSNSIITDFQLEFITEQTKFMFDQLKLTPPKYNPFNLISNPDYLDVVEQFDILFSSINDIIDAAHDFKDCFRDLMLVFFSFYQITHSKIYIEVIKKLNATIKILCSSGGTGLINIKNSHMLQTENIKNLIAALNLEKVQSIIQCPISNLDDPIEVKAQSTDDDEDEGDEGVDVNNEEKMEVEDTTNKGFVLMQARIESSQPFNVLKESGKKIDSVFTTTTKLPNGPLNEIDGCIGEECSVTVGSSSTETWVCPLFGCIRARVEATYTAGELKKRGTVSSNVYMKYNSTNEIYFFTIIGPVVLDEVVALLQKGRARNENRPKKDNITFKGKYFPHKDVDIEPYFRVRGNYHIPTNLDHNMLVLQNLTIDSNKAIPEDVLFGESLSESQIIAHLGQFTAYTEFAKQSMAIIGLKTMCDKRLFHPINTRAVNGFSTVDYYVIIAYIIAYLLGFIYYVPYIFYSGGINTYSVYSFNETNNDLLERYSFFHSFMISQGQTPIEETNEFIQYNISRLSGTPHTKPISSIWEYITCKTIANHAPHWKNVTDELFGNIKELEVFLGNKANRANKQQLITLLSKIPKRYPTINDICLQLFKQEDVFLVDDTQRDNRKLRIKKELYDMLPHLKQIRENITDAELASTINNIDDNFSELSRLTEIGRSYVLGNILDGSERDVKRDRIRAEKAIDTQKAFLDAFKYNGKNIEIDEGYIVFTFSKNNKNIISKIHDYNREEFVQDNPDEKLIFEETSRNCRIKLPFKLETVFKIISNFPRNFTIEYIDIDINKITQKTLESNMTQLAEWLFYNAHEDWFEMVITPGVGGEDMYKKVIANKSTSNNFDEFKKKTIQQTQRTISRAPNTQKSNIVVTYNIDTFKDLLNYINQNISEVNKHFTILYESTIRPFKIDLTGRAFDIVIELLDYKQIVDNLNSIDKEHLKSRFIKIVIDIIPQQITDSLFILNAYFMGIEQISISASHEAYVIPQHIPDPLPEAGNVSTMPNSPPSVHEEDPVIKPRSPAARSPPRSTARSTARSRSRSRSRSPPRSTAARSRSRSRSRSPPRSTARSWSRSHPPNNGTPVSKPRSRSLSRLHIQNNNPSFPQIAMLSNVSRNSETQTAAIKEVVEKEVVEKKNNRNKTQNKRHMARINKNDELYIITKGGGKKNTKSNRPSTKNRKTRKLLIHTRT